MTALAEGEVKAVARTVTIDDSRPGTSPAEINHFADRVE